MKSFFIKSIEGNNRWYLYVATILISYIGAQFIMAPIMLIYYHIIDFKSTMTEMFPPTLGGFILALTTFAVCFVALWFCIKFINRKRFINVITGRSKLDFKRIAVGAAVWGVILILYYSLQFAIGGADSLQFQFDASKFFPLLFFALILFPFQTTFEEVLIRGYLMQGIFRLSKNVWVPFLATSIIFAVMHIANPEVAAIGVWKVMSYFLAMGLFLAAITIFDNGLELAIGVHFINNFLSVMFVTTNVSALRTPGSLFFDAAPTMSYIDVLAIIIMAIVFILTTQRIFKYKFSFKN